MSDDVENIAKDTGAIAIPRDTSVPASPYSQIRREISEKDLESPAVQRLLLGEVDRLKYQVEKLEAVERQFHLIDKKCSVQEEKIKALMSQEVLYGFCLTVGAAIMGLSSLVWEKGAGWSAIFIGLALIIGAVLSKVIKWR